MTRKNVNACLNLNKDRKIVFYNSLKQNAKQMNKVMAGPILILYIYAFQFLTYQMQLPNKAQTKKITNRFIQELINPDQNISPA